MSNSVEEEFEIHWQTTPLACSGNYSKEALLTMYLAGRADERKRCVEVIRNIPSKCDWSAWDMEVESIAAIERQEGI